MTYEQRLEQEKEVNRSLLETMLKEGLYLDGDLFDKTMEIYDELVKDWC